MQASANLLANQHDASCYMVCAQTPPGDCTQSVWLAEFIELQEWPTCLKILLVVGISTSIVYGKMANSRPLDRDHSALLC
jgi:hypothetical protein